LDEAILAVKPIKLKASVHPVIYYYKEYGKHQENYLIHWWSCSKL